MTDEKGREFMGKYAIVSKSRKETLFSSSSREKGTSIFISLFFMVINTEQRPAAYVGLNRLFVTIFLGPLAWDSVLFSLWKPTTYWFLPWIYAALPTILNVAPNVEDQRAFTSRSFAPFPC